MEAGQYVFDLDRILFGKLPWYYLLEILFRTAIMYVYALFVVRMLGKRGMGQLAPFDFVIIIALGSAVGDPMFYPEVPLFHALVAFTAMVVFTRGLVWATQRNRTLQNFISTNATRLVCDGVMDLEKMKAEGISRDELFEGLREEGVQQLGEIERTYLEPNGKISVFRRAVHEIEAGVPLLPQSEEPSLLLFSATDRAPADANYSCWECGGVEHRSQGASFGECRRCGCSKWVRAVLRLRDLRALNGADTPDVQKAE